MKPFFISEILTQEGIIHQGMYFSPKKPGKRAILWNHGLTSNFYSSSSRIEVIVSLCDNSGIGFAAFNTRGHDILSSAHKVDTESESGYSHITIGSGNEHFEESVFDIEAGIDFLARKGFTEILLVGSSTGANKACYYASTQQNKFIKGIVLLSPLSDRLLAGISWYKMLYLRMLVAVGLGEKIISSGSYFSGTPKRFLSLITPKSLEDVFDYGDPEPCMKLFSTITLPLLVMFGGADTLADRSIENIRRQFDTHQQSSHYSSIILQGANHGFDGKEKEVAEILISWIKEI